MSELSPVVVKKTQDTLGKFVQKPNLSDKLLRKPPFKFLHDVINVVIQSTGFLKGLYTEEELNSENVKDRDAKIEFLQKAIDVVKLATKENIKARPSKIVAGLEPEKTNEFLQAIGKAIEKKINSSEAVEAVKNGNVESIQKENKVAKKKEERTAAASKLVKDKVGANQNQKVKDVKTKSNVRKSDDKVEKAKTVVRQGSKDSDSSKTKAKSVKATEQKKPEVKRSSERRSPRASTKDKQSLEPSVVKNPIKDVVPNLPEKLQDEKEKINEEKIVKEKPEKERNEKNVGSESEKIRKKVNGAALKEDHAEEKTQDNIKNAASVTISNGDVEAVEVKPEILKEKPEILKEKTEILKEKSAKKDEKSRKSEKINDDTTENHQSRKPHSPPNAAPANKDISNQKLDSPQKPEQNGKPKSSKHPPEPIRKKSSFMKPIPNGDANDSVPSRPTTAIRGPSIRPPSARPGAPRRRDRNVEIILQTEKTMQDAAEKNPPANFVADLADDGENLVVIDNTNLQGDILPREPDHQLGIGNEMEQGHLVQQILETQTVFSKAGTEGASGSDGKKEGESDLKAPIEKLTSSKNLEVIRDAIQKLTRFISPLGKLLEYIHEDVEAMQNELSTWRQANMKAEVAIKREKEQTEKSMESFKYQLFEIENTIEDHTLQINSAMANIIENEEKLYKMVLDV